MKRVDQEEYQTLLIVLKIKKKKHLPENSNLV